MAKSFEIETGTIFFIPIIVPELFFSLAKTFSRKSCAFDLFFTIFV